MPSVGLRARITLLVAATVAICLLAGFAAVYAGTASRLQADIDHGLRADMAELQHATAGPSAQRAAQAYIARQPFRATTNVMFVAAPGRPVATNEPELLATAGGDPDDTPAERAGELRQAAAVLGAPVGFSRRTLPGVGHVRVLTAMRGPLRFGVAEPLEPVMRATDTIARALLLAAALGMAAALAGGLLIASGLAAPLRRMARVAARVDAGDLSPRMGLHGPRDEVRTLAHSFDQMLDRLEDAFARQSAFVADASHELRTPLTIMRGQLEVLAMDPHPSAERVRHVESLVRPEIDRMSRLIEDLLLLAHAADEDLVRPEPIDLPDFLADVCAGLRAGTDRRLELAPVPPVVVTADPHLLAQAVRNLLRNAIVHTDAGGLVRLSVRQHGDTLRLTVDDDGPGVPAEQRERIFDRFTRLDHARGRDHDGAGLGLAIVQATAVAHQGRVGVRTSPEGGAQFVIDLPAQGIARDPDR